MSNIAKYILLAVLLIAVFFLIRSRLPKIRDMFSKLNPVIVWGLVIAFIVAAITIAISLWGPKGMFLSFDKDANAFSKEATISEVIVEEPGTGKKTENSISDIVETDDEGIKWVKIRISGDKIYVKDGVAEIDSLISALSENINTINVEIIDDYALSNSYRDVIKRLRDVGIFNYEETKTGK